MSNTFLILQSDSKFKFNFNTLLFFKIYFHFQFVTSKILDMAHVDASNTGNRQRDFGARIQRLRDAKDNKMMEDVERCAVNEGRSTKVMLLGAFLLVSTVGMLSIAFLPYWVYGGNDIWMGLENHGGLLGVFIDGSGKTNARGALKGLIDLGASGNSFWNTVQDVESSVYGHATYISLAPKVCSFQSIPTLSNLFSPTCNAVRMMIWGGIFMLVAILGCCVANIISVVYLWLGQRWHKVQYLKTSQIVLTIGTVVLFIAFIVMIICSFQWFKFMNVAVAFSFLGNSMSGNYLPWSGCMYTMWFLMILQIAANIMAWMMPVYKIAGVNAIMEGMCADDGSYGTNDTGYHDPHQTDYGYNEYGQPAHYA